MFFNKIKKLKSKARLQTDLLHSQQPASRPRVTRSRAGIETQTIPMTGPSPTAPQRHPQACSRKLREPIQETPGGMKLPLGLQGILLTHRTAEADRTILHPYPLNVHLKKQYITITGGHKGINPNSFTGSAMYTCSDLVPQLGP